MPDTGVQEGEKGGRISRVLAGNKRQGTDEGKEMNTRLQAAQGLQECKTLPTTGVCLLEPYEESCSGKGVTGGSHSLF